MGIFDFFKKFLSDNPKNTQLAEHRKEEIKRQVQILSESIELVNNSCDIQVVLRRYNITQNSLQYLSQYTDEELHVAGFQTKEPLLQTLNSITSNKVTIINQAIKRNVDKKLSSYKSQESKINAFQRLYDTIRYLDGLGNDNIAYLDSLRDEIINKSKNSPSIMVDTGKHIKTTYENLPNNNFRMTVSSDDFIDDFYSLSTKINEEKDIYKKLEACEKSYQLLPEFCRYCIEDDEGELPPIINCRDIGPELYMRLGKWNEAENAIRKCIEARAYFPDDGSDVLDYLDSYKKVANKTLSYIEQNPGCLQRSIYNKLSLNEDERDILKHFLRCSLLITKEKSGNTNKLFIKTE